MNMQNGLPPLPPGFMLEPAPSSMPALPPGFEIMQPEPAAQPPEASGAYQAARAGYLGALDGGSFSFADELGAGLGAVSERIGSLVTGEKPRTYDELLTRMRDQNREAQTEAPISYGAGQIAGGIANAGGMVKAAPTVGAKLLGIGGKSTIEKAGAAALSSAGFGGVQGFGSGEGGLGNRMIEAAKGSGIGLGLGLAAYPAGAVIGKGVNAAVDALGNARATFSPATQELFRRTLADEGLTLEEAGRRAQALGPQAMLADASEGLRLRTEQIAQSDNPGRSGVMAALKDRNATASGRINSAYDEALGPRPNVQQTLSTMASEAKTRADTLYGEARRQNLPVDVNPVIQAIDGQLMTPAERIAGRPDLPADDVDNALSWVRSHLTDGSSQRTGIDHLDRLERRVRARTKAAFDSGRSDVGHALNEVGKVLRGQMKASSPVYAEARATFADDMAVKDAFETGQKLFGRKVHPDFLAAEVADMSEAERSALTLGVRAAVDEAMGGVRNGSLKGRQLLDADFNERKILTVLGEEDGRALIAALQGEQAMAETANQALGNSATSRRMDNPFRVQQRTAQDAAIPGMLRSAANLQFGNAAARGLEYAQDAFAKRAAGSLVREAGPVLTATGNARDDAVNEMVRLLSQGEARRLSDPKRQAIVDTLLRGGLLGYDQPSAPAGIPR